MTTPQDFSNPVMERNLLGTLAKGFTDAHLIFDTVPDEAFADPHRQIIYSAIKEVVKAHRVVDCAVLQDHLDKIGSGLRLSDHIEATVVPSMAKVYGVCLLESMMKTEIQSICLLAIDALETEEAEDVAAKLKTDLAEAMTRGADVEILDRQQTIMLAMAVDDSETIRSGMSALDFLVGGFRSGELITIGGRAGHGKSTFAKFLQTRIVPPTLFLSGEEDVSKFHAAWSVMDPNKRSEPYLALPTPLTTQIVRRATHQAIRQFGVRAIFVDHINLMRDLSVTRGEGRVAELTAISRSMKELAREFDVVVFMLAQLNRSGFEDPRIHHLKGSGGIEEDSDVVILLNREDHPQPNGDYKFEISCVKRRGGGMTGSIHVTGKAATMTFHGETVEEMTERMRKEST